jgi:c-di-GMP-binding flagellar brake protein YcgR
LWLGLGSWFCRPIREKHWHARQCLHALHERRQRPLQFTVNHAVSTVYQDRPAFYLALPDSLYRLQRREYFRLTTPVVNPLRCVIAGNPLTKKQPREFILMDVSCGGVGLLCLETDIDLTPGQSYSDCQIELPELGTIKATIEVRNLVLVTLKSGTTQRRAGCEFKNLEGSSIILLQRYVTNMQRAQGKS